MQQHIKPPFWDLLKRCYAGMTHRCYDPKDQAYMRYGGKGIIICERWKNDFISFYTDMAPSFRPGLTIERINVLGNYEPDNCKWATLQEQSKNKTNSRFLYFNGEKKLLIDWARDYGISDNTLRRRIKLGWEIGKAITTPAYRKNKALNPRSCKLCDIEFLPNSPVQIFCSLQHKNMFNNRLKTKKHNK